LRRRCTSRAFSFSGSCAPRSDHALSTFCSTGGGVRGRGAGRGWDVFRVVCVVCVRGCGWRGEAVVCSRKWWSDHALSTFWCPCLGGGSGGGAGGGEWV
jgi:hypothetical protein